jgi:hypothetical protein
LLLAGMASLLELIFCRFDLKNPWIISLFLESFILNGEKSLGPELSIRDDTGQKNRSVWGRREE